MNESRKLEITTGSWIRAVIIVGIAYALYQVTQFVLVIVTAVVIASAIEPVAIWAKKMNIHRLPVVILVYISSIFLFAGLVYLLLFPLIGEVNSLLKTLTIYFNSAANGDVLFDMFQNQNVFSGLDTPILKELSTYLNSFSDFLSRGIFSSLSTIFGGVLSFVLVLVMSFYLVVQDDGVAKFLRIVTPLKHESYVVSLWKRSQYKIGRWMQGQLITSAAVAVMVYIGLLIIGLPQALLLAVLAGVFDLIPIFGPIIASIPAIFIAFVHGGTSTALIVAAIYLVVQQIESNGIYPLVHNKLIGVPPMISIPAVVIGGELAGFLGVVIAMPIAAVLMELVSDWEERKLAKATPELNA
jgi:predicted PurR-regulated permease PerM